MRRRTGVAIGGVAALAGALLAAPSSAAPEPVWVAFVLDTSGSVGRVGLARARELTEGVLAHLPPGSRVAVFTFDDESRLILPGTDSVSAVRRALGTVQVKGRHTALHDALYDASRYLRGQSGRAAIVLVTDGRDENSALNLDDGLRLAQESGIATHAVGVGGAEERVLRRIAKLTGGQYMSGADTQPERLAAAIAGAGPRAAGRPRDETARAGATAAGAGASAAEAAAAPATPPARGFARRAWIGAAVALVVVAAVLVVARRRSAGPRCPDCGRPLPDALSNCAFCPPPLPKRVSTAPAAPGGPNGGVSPALAGELAPTLMARMNTTEEYLEKTITLVERPVLSITRGPGSGRSFDLSSRGSTSLGRGRVNDIVLEDVAVSSEHCRIRPEEGRYVLHDLKSTNGTFVNDHRVTLQPLAEGDVIQIGETWLQFKLEHRRG